MNILILEDEIPAFEKLLIALQEHYGNTLKYDWGRSILEAKNFLSEQADYDFILSDIQLLDGSVFELFEMIEVKTPIIFCSAHDNYLLDAFSANGIAYVLKPYTNDKLTKALHKYESLFRSDQYEPISAESIDQLKSHIAKENQHYRTRFVIKKKTGIQLVNVEEVALISAEGDFCKLHSSEGATHVFSQNIGGIALSLNPKQFFRINRSEMVNIDHITRIEKYFKNRLAIFLSGQKEKVITSTGSTAEFRNWLEG